MKELSSRQFRTAYPRLTEPVLVMVHGHPIGTWLPVGEIPALKMADFAARAYDVPLRAITSPEERDRLARGLPIREPASWAGVPLSAITSIEELGGGRPFTPVPKPGRK